MAESENKKTKEMKFAKSVKITGLIWLLTLMIMLVLNFFVKLPDATVFIATWSWIVMPVALAAFILSLLWNNTEDGRTVNIKTLVTVAILFVFMIYFLVAVIMVWIAKVDSMPPIQDNSISYQQVQATEVEEFS